MALQFDYIEPNLTLTSEEIRSHRDENFQNLLENKKLHLILDLDHTLIHSTSIYSNKVATSNEEIEPYNPMNDTYEILNGTYTVKLRPGAREFVEQVSSMFELSVYTLSQRNYAREVVKLFDYETEDGTFSRFKWVIAKEDCVNHRRKGLNKVLSHQEVVLIVDDSRKVWMEYGSKNLIHVSPYYYFFEEEKNTSFFNVFGKKKKKKKEIDKALARVLAILEEVHRRFYDKDFEQEFEHGKVNLLYKHAGEILQQDQKER
ncbi:RNA polymerase II C-terminal domain phosphatase-like 4 [Bienertia sinuspersici]